MNLLYAIVLSMGLTRGGIVQYNPTYYTEIDDPIYVSMDADVQYGPIFANCGIRVDTWMLSAGSYSPWQNTYQIGAGIRFGMIELGVTHSCYHPMQAYQWCTYQYTPAWEGAHTTVYGKLILTNR